MPHDGQVIDRQFVEDWAGRYRREAAAAQWSAGPKMKAAMKDHPELRPLSGVTNYWDLELYIFDTIGPSIRKTGAFTLPEFLIVAYWKARRQLASYRLNEADEGCVTRVTRRAFSRQVPDGEKPRVLCELRGVQVSVASALLTVWNADKFSIIDVRALQTLCLLGESVEGIEFKEHPQRWWKEHYGLYMRACLGIHQRVMPLSLRDVDRALWKWSQVNASR
jgi:hypothetical protein